MPKTPITDLTPDQRFQQVAAILAKGVIRHQRSQRRGESRSGENLPESPTGGLEVPTKTRLSVSRCIGG
jgi:hypothetical protein